MTVAELPTAAVTLRPVDRDADAGFLLAVYASTRADELAVVPWDDGQKDAFLLMQFTAQDAYWREHKANVTWDVVLVDGVPAGRLYVDRLQDEIRVVDIALLAGFRGAGVGGALLRDILNEGRDAGLPVTIHVERTNPARSLYERLGFRQIDTTGVYDLFECPPNRDQP
jgi:GNAT superfamily N-acetyltransferase